MSSVIWRLCTSRSDCLGLRLKAKWPSEKSRTVCPKTRRHIAGKCKKQLRDSSPDAAGFIGLAWSFRWCSQAWNLTKRFLYTEKEVLKVRDCKIVVFYGGCDAALKKRVKTEELRNIEHVTSCILFSAFIAPVFGCVSSLFSCLSLCYSYHFSLLRYGKIFPFILPQF
jgi:hypothetical protein